MADTFSGRVYRLANSTRTASSFRDLFILGVGEEREGDLKHFLKLFTGASSSWVIEVVPFEDATKRDPALLYRRFISTRTSAERFREGYFDGSPTKPEGGPPRTDGKEPIPMAARGSVESRTMVLEIEAKAFKADPDDPWYDVRYSYERYGARALLEVPGGFEESVWLVSTGFDVDPAPIVESAVKARAAALGGRLLALDDPQPANNTGHIGTGTFLNRVFREAPGGPAEFESRIVNLSAWG